MKWIQLPYIQNATNREIFHVNDLLHVESCTVRCKRCYVFCKCFSDATNESAIIFYLIPAADTHHIGKICILKIDQCVMATVKL